MPVWLGRGTTITLSGSTLWQDHDITTQLGTDAGNVVGVIIRFEASATRTVGARANGSTQSTNIVHSLVSTRYATMVCGCDSNDIIELYQSATGSLTCYLMGYFLTGEAEFDDTTAMVSYNDDSSGWNDRDVSSDITGSPVAVILNLSGDCEADATYGVGHRPNGSTSTDYILTQDDCYSYVQHVVIVGVNSNIYEYYKSSSFPRYDTMLVGWLFADSGYVATDPPVDVEPSTTSTWEDTDTLPHEDAIGVYIFDRGENATYRLGIRPNGETDGSLYNTGIQWSGGDLQGCDANGVVEVYTSTNSFINVFRTGYFAPVEASGDGFFSGNNF